METIHLVVWEFSDKSGWGIVRAFTNESDATDMLTLMKAHGDRQFSIVSTLIQSEYGYE